ncbi:MAG TPA: monooxygenase [Gemmataceae bacterium]|nr:monooxygenase [Gemmataceae bacterium]
MARMEPPRIAVLGAGPIGLEAALYAAALNLPFKIYERGRVGEYLRRWGHVRMFTPFGMNSTPLGRARIRADQPEHPLPESAAMLTGREHVAAYLEPLALAPVLTPAIHENTAVLQIGRRGLLKGDYPGDARRGKEPFRLLLRDDKGRERIEEADVVLDCTGVYGNPRRLGCGGIAAVGEAAARQHIAFGLEDIAGERKSHYADKTTLVIGAGHSAAATVCALAALAEKHPATWVIWLARGAGSQPIRRITGDPLRERDLLAVRANNLATRPDGNVEFHAQTVVEAIETAGPDRGFKVSARSGGRVVSWDVERIIANVGYSPEAGLYRELQVQESGDSLRPKTTEPNFYVLGAKSHGRDSNFLLRTGLEQVRDVMALIAGKPGLDLYKARAA